MQQGNGERAERLSQIKKKLDAEGSWWKHEGRDPVDGIWVTNDDDWRDPTRKSRHIDKPDPEIKHWWSYGDKEGKRFGGKRPSKPKDKK